MTTPKAPGQSWICKGCWLQMKVPIPLRGPLSWPLRLAGIRRTQMHPDLCTVCETMFTRVKRRKQIEIDATVLFADLRGYTALSAKANPGEIAEMLHVFYDECAKAVWSCDGIVNKFIGDAVLAIFNFPITRTDHARQAIAAGIAIQRGCREKGLIVADAADVPIGVGIGIHSGRTSIGEVGTSYKDFTAIGAVVNLASRLQGAARTGEVVVSEAVSANAGDLLRGAKQRMCALKGIEEPVPSWVLSPT